MAVGIKVEEAAAGPPIAVETGGGLNVPLVKICTGPDGQFDRITPEAPLPVSVQAPANTYDTGSVLISAGVDTISAIDFFVDVLVVTNLTEEIQIVTVTDGDDVPYLNEVPLDPKELRVYPLSGIRFANGMKAQAEVAGSVRLHARGTR